MSTPNLNVVAIWFIYFEQKLVLRKITAYSPGKCNFKLNYLNQVHKLIEKQVYKRNNALTSAGKEDGTNAVPWQQPQYECLTGSCFSFL